MYGTKKSSLRIVFKLLVGGVDADAGFAQVPKETSCRYIGELDKGQGSDD